MASARGMWLKDHELCVQLGQDIMVAINCRSKQPKGSSGYLKESANIRTMMRQFSTKFNALRQDLVSTNMRYSMTHRELESRQAMLDDLYTKEKQLEQAIKGDRPSPLAGRSALLDPVANAGAVSSGDPWGVAQTSSGDDPDQYADLNFDGIRQQQQHAIREQDEGLDVLSQVLHRQKNMALDIGNEVDAHNELLDDITVHTELTDQRLVRETKHIKIIDRKSNTCCYWIVASILFLAIIIILVVPYNGKA